MANSFIRQTTVMALCLSIFLAFSKNVKAQYLWNSDSAYKVKAPMSGHLWGYAFGDYYYKAHADALGRGDGNQYAGLPQDDNAFAIRRIYLGYDFNYNKKFSSHLLLAAENWNKANNLAPYIKNAYFSWNNIFKGSELQVGLVSTPLYPSVTKYWGYRSIEKTISVFHGTPTVDLGVALKGYFDADKKFGYHVLIGNGSGAKADNDKFKRYYGSLSARFLDKKLTINLYDDYHKIDWEKGFHHAMNMTKFLVGYHFNNFTVGAEAYLNQAKQDVIQTGQDTTNIDTVNANALGLSVYVRGNIIKNKLKFYARFDLFNPYLNYSNKYTYSGLSAHYAPNTKERFVSVGLDYMPFKNIHLMPNIWYSDYTAQNGDLTGTAQHDYDLVYRLTFYYIFGK